MVISIRELMGGKKIDSASNDYLAFIILCLNQLELTIERTVTPWEKRDYWLKADKYRREWDWVKYASKRLSDNLKNENWNEIASEIVQIGIKLNDIKVSTKHRMGTPWVGAYEHYLNAKKNGGLK